MLGLLIYLVVTVAIGFVLSFLILTFRSTKKRGDGAPFGTIAFCLILAVFGPFLYVESLTRLFGKDMEKAIKATYQDAPIDGPMKYFRIVSYNGKKAEALVIGEERDLSGISDRPVFSTTLENEEKGWTATGYKMVYSNRLNKDGFVIPPYR